MIVNELKTKIMTFGSDEKVSIKFNGSIIEQVKSYKYLGCVIRSIKSSKSDPFLLNYEHLARQANKAVFAAKQKMKSIGPLPPQILFYMFNTLIKPILLYTSEIWGVYKNGRDSINNFFLKYMKRALGVKKLQAQLWSWVRRVRFTLV